MPDPELSGARTVIEAVHVGDLVAARNADTDKTEYRRVTRLLPNTASTTITVGLADPATGKLVDTITATPEHPFFVPGQGAIELGKLGIGTQIVTRAGPPLVIASLAVHQYPHGLAVYNFEVDGDHTYFVGSAHGGLWVHNSCGGVYKLLNDAEEFMRTGRTNDFDRRRLEHKRQFPDLDFQPFIRTDDPAEQRGMEQLAHDHYTPPLNRINPISPKNKNRGSYMDAGHNWIHNNGDPFG